MKGLVSLVGAGPGDPELLTLKAMHRLQAADLVIYDYLANPEHLRHTRPGTAMRCVGKRFRYHPESQRRMLRLLSAYARKGKRVVRLKGGDPYLFGRGGEEALVLAKNRIPFEVIPGVTSANGCAAYAGIPLTHRDHNANVTFLTGHRANDDGLDSVSWEHLVKLKGTLVVYMGFYNLEIISKKLKAAGLPGRTPAAVIEWGTLPSQRSCDGTLDTIVRIVRQKKFHAPCLIVIGGVVALRRKLNWFEKLPLFGKRVVVTRSAEKTGEIGRRLSAWGAEVLEFPTLELMPPENWSDLDKVIGRLGSFDWIVFTSAFGVEIFFGRLEDRFSRDARAFAGARVAAVGPKTAEALDAHGVKADLVPPRYETAEIGRALMRRQGRLNGVRILLLRADVADGLLDEELAGRGAAVTRVNAYRTRLPRRVPQEALRRIRQGKVDAVLFTSASTVRHFIRLVGLKTVKKLARRAQLASIGPVTSSELSRAGLRPSLEAKIFTVEGLLNRLREAIAP